MYKVLYFVDGDNNPGMRTEGISRLPADVKVRIYYASNNTYYTRTTNRDALTVCTDCAVEFMKVPAGKNAVDLMIAIDAAAELTKTDMIRGIVLVSADKHFCMISSFLKNRWPDVVIKSAGTVKQGHEVMDLLSVSSLQDMHRILIQKYGTQAGSEVYRTIRGLSGGAKGETDRLMLPMAKPKMGYMTQFQKWKLFGILGKRMVGGR